MVFPRLRDGLKFEKSFQEALIFLLLHPAHPRDELGALFFEKIFDFPIFELTFPKKIITCTVEVSSGVIFK